VRSLQGPPGGGLAISDAAPTVSLVIPSYCQRDRTRRSAHEAAEYLRTLPGEHGELIVVDDGSEPGTGVTAADLPPGAVFIGLPRNLGKGGAVRAGVLRARGSEVIFTDSDLPFSLDPIPTTLAWLRGDADLVIGDRLLPESECATEVTAMRQLSSVVFTVMVKGLCRLPLDDTQCGYKGYRRDVARTLFAPLEMTSFAFEVEVLLRARHRGYRLKRQALRLMHNDDTSVRLSRHAPQMIGDTLRIAWRNARGRYAA
jgi:dolichyl-phosphate beta-glucosyltransferase